MSAFTSEQEHREASVAAVRKLDALGLNRGSTGNLSQRWADDGRSGMLITPTGMGADDLRPEDLVWVGEDGTVQGAWQPSSEWHFHQAIYRARADLHAVVHVHSTYATALACLPRRLPPFHYMVAVAGGDDVPLVPYSTFGSVALSEGVARAVANRDACLLAQHGLLAAGTTLARAMKVVVEIESLCQTYLSALAIDEPPHLNAAQMAEVIDKFRSYGQARRG